MLTLVMLPLEKFLPRFTSEFAPSQLVKPLLTINQPTQVAKPSITQFSNPIQESFFTPFQAPISSPIQTPFSIPIQTPISDPFQEQIPKLPSPQKPDTTTPTWLSNDTKLMSPFNPAGFKYEGMGLSGFSSPRTDRFGKRIRYYPIATPKQVLDAMI
jgi:hypothetical protein